MLVRAFEERVFWGSIMIRLFIGGVQKLALETAFTSKIIVATAVMFFASLSEYAFGRGEHDRLKNDSDGLCRERGAKSTAHLSFRIARARRCRSRTIPATPIA